MVRGCYIPAVGRALILLLFFFSGAAGLVYGMLLFWHATGAVQRGFNRYSLDYLPVLLALVAPTCCVGWRRWVSLAMVGWSVLYFRWRI